ncbi:MAG TPA: type II toxin-antitoxin system RelE/ParE family toxin [Bryobacteraceae bacterium]|nr:type II toxin-antitoxin system RelE/ParE family toxin [Bryobacteraceae bacterium]
MLIRWSPAAVDDLEQIFNYIQSDDPAAAQRTIQAIYESAEALGRHPHLGRLGRVRGTRELIVPALPFLVVYRVVPHVDAIEIANIIHGAQRWPPSR